MQERVTREEPFGDRLGDARADERCEFCHGPLYRVSLLDGELEPLDHRECALLSQAA